MFNVLVIDDSLTVRAIIEQLLEGEKDLRVVGSADSVVAAREMIDKFMPSVITLDLSAKPRAAAFSARSARRTRCRGATSTCWRKACRNLSCNIGWGAALNVISSSPPTNPRRIPVGLFVGLGSNLG